MNLVFIGPSGVGKGTHAALFCSGYQLRHIAIGSLLRQNLDSNSASGAAARQYMVRGELVPDDVVDGMIEERMRRLEPEMGALFDGFPVTDTQACFLESLLKSFNRTLDAVIYLKVADDDIVWRLSGRLTCRLCQATYHVATQPPKSAGTCDVCGGCELYQRGDDSGELAHKRLRVFHRNASPVIDYYAAKNKLIVVSGAGTIEAVQTRLIETLDAVKAGNGRYATRAEAGEIMAKHDDSGQPPRPAHRGVDLVLLGGPGSGKGTQAEQLSRQLHLPHIATGDLFRDNLKNATELGKLAKTYMNRGELVPDDVTEAMVEERLARPDTRNGFILDGFPRTLPQARALTAMMNNLGRNIAGVLYINVSDEAIVSRLSGRLICRACQTPYHRQFKPPKQAGICDRCGGELYQRDDDNPNTVHARLKTFHGQTEPLIAYYQQAGLLHEIPGEGEVAQVVERTLATARRLAQTVASAQ